MTRWQYPDTGQAARRGGERLSDVVEVTLYLRASVPAARHPTPSRLPSVPFLFLYAGRLGSFGRRGHGAVTPPGPPGLHLSSSPLRCFSTACVGSVKRSCGMGPSGLVVY